MMNDKRRNYNLYGGVAQLGEHLPCKQGVMGSNPIISTMRTLCAIYHLSFIAPRFSFNDKR